MENRKRLAALALRRLTSARAVLEEQETDLAQAIYDRRALALALDELIKRRIADVPPDEIAPIAANDAALKMVKRLERIAEVEADARHAVAAARADALSALRTFENSNVAAGFPETAIPLAGDDQP